jgi:hypothetical protein
MPELLLVCRFMMVQHGLRLVLARLLLISCWLVVEAQEVEAILLRKGSVAVVLEVL